ncbi:MAG: glycosyltransferase family 39 protein [Pirellulaceae bacterium]|nr:glycosyltransferase family 39 protein [Pirellulaceae bacterium]
MSRRTTYSLLLGILVFSLVLRVGASYWWQDRVDKLDVVQVSHGAKFNFPDSPSYWSLGKQIAEGKPYEYDGGKIFRTPGYPILLSLCFYFYEEPSPLLARWIGAVLGMFVVWEVYLLTTLLFSRQSGLIAAFLTAIYPGAIAMSVFVLSEALFCPLMLLQFFCWQKGWQGEIGKIELPVSERLGYWLLTGFLGGLAVLVRPSWLLFMPFTLIFGIAFFLIYREKCGLKRHLLASCWILVGLVVAMGPWWARNYQLTGHFVPTTLQVGASLYDGLSPIADGSSNMEYVPRFKAQLRSEDRQALKENPTLTPSSLNDSFEERLDRRMKEESIAWAQENPGKVVQLAGVKFLRIWSFWPSASEFKNQYFGWVLILGFTPLLVFGLMGAYRMRKSWSMWLFVMPAIYFTALHMVFVGSIRYRQPAMLTLIVLGAPVVISLLGACCRRCHKQES